jgi:AraC family transcriptional regulator
MDKQKGVSSEAELTRLRRMQRAIRFMEDHLTEPITIADAADAACYSLYHFCRIFNSVAHHSPYDYLIRRRLSEAARCLLESRVKIIDIALDFQFNSPESFSRAFKKMFAVQPKQFRSRACLDRRHLLTELSLDHLVLMSRAVNLIPERVHLEELTITGLMSPILDDSATASRLWEDLDTELEIRKKSHAAPIGMSRYVGIASFPKGWIRSGFYYFAGVPQQGTGASNPALTTKQMPTGDYARFTFKAKLKELTAILDYVFQTWLPKSDHTSDIPFIVLSYRTRPSPEDDEEIEQQVFVPLN